MYSFRRVVVAMLFSSFLVAATCFAETDTEAKKQELKRVVEQLRINIGDKKALAALTFPEDTSPRFVVRELRINGNDLISTAKLLKKLPLVYNVSVREGETTVEKTYDFRVFHEIIVDPGQEREVSLTSIQGLTKYVLSVYQEQGYTGIYVYIPVEAVISGEVMLKNEILPVEVLEGKLSEIIVKRYDFDRPVGENKYEEKEEGYLKKSVLESWSPAKVGEVITKDKLDDFIRLLNLNPDRYISAIISRSDEPDALNLGYEIYEADPWHRYIQVDNAGTKDRQWFPRIGIVNTNLTGRDDKFSIIYQAPWEKGIEEEYSLFGSYEFPFFTPRLRLNLYGGYSQFDITPDGGMGVNFIGNGSFYGSVLSYNVSQIDRWFIDVTGSLSHERSKVTPSLGLASDVDMDLWGVGVNVHRSNDMSNTSLTFNRTESMGGSSEADFTDARLNTDPDFIIYNFGAAHSQYLDSDKINRLSGSFRLITSNERLVPAKMTTFGGLYSVRGYNEDEIVSDGGMIVSGQYEFDLVKHGKAMENRGTDLDEKQGEKPWIRKLAPLAFIDYGRAKIKDPVVGEQEVRKLCSVGGGLLVELGDNLSVAAYYGWPLRKTVDTKKGDGRLNLSLILRW